MTSNPRPRFQGVHQIIAYNWHFYAGALFLLGGAFIAMRFVPEGFRHLVQAAMLISAFWVASSIIVSFYVYDLSELYEWRWISRAIPSAPRSWFHVHAGLDESSASIRDLYPGARSEVIDIYDPKEMSEPSIARARKDSGDVRKAAYTDLGIPSGSHDTGFIIFTAHEVRSSAGRERLFSEAARALGPGGRLLLVEHPRDALNFLAFGPGALHFFPRGEWLRVGKRAGFRLCSELKITPFVSCFVFEKPA